MVQLRQVYPYPDGRLFSSFDGLQQQEGGSPRIGSPLIAASPSMTLMFFLLVLSLAVAYGAHTARTAVMRWREDCSAAAERRELDARDDARYRAHAHAVRAAALTRAAQVTAEAQAALATANVRSALAVTRRRCRELIAARCSYLYFRHLSRSCSRSRICVGCPACRHGSTPNALAPSPKVLIAAMIATHTRAAQVAAEARAVLANTNARAAPAVTRRRCR